MKNKLILQGAAFLLIAGSVAAAQAAPLPLRECLTEALSNNPLLTEGRLAVAAGKQGVMGAAAKRFPRITFDSNYTKRQNPFPFVPAEGLTIPAHFSDEFASWQAALTIPIYQGGQIENGIKLAEMRKTIQEDTLTLTRNEIIANTVNTYNKLIQLGKLREASLASVKALEEQRKNAELLLNLGRMARVDLLKVEVQLANERQRLANLEEGIATTRETLAYFMGRSVDTGESAIEPEGELSFAPVTVDFDRGLISARERLPEYLIARDGLDETELIIRITKGKTLPTLSAFGSYQDQFGFNPSYTEGNWFFGLNVSIPLFDRPLYADLSRDRILHERAATHLVSVENRIRLDIRTALTSIADSKGRAESSREAVRQADESFRIEREKYAAGAGAMVDLLLAQAADFTAVANYTQSLYDYNAAIVAYRKATGILEDYLK